MPGSTFGTLLKITTWGESHGKGVGVVIDGCPPKIPLTEDMIQKMMDRRKPGSSIASTSRKEADKAVIMSGVFDGMTTGTPIMIMLFNTDADSSSYSPFRTFSDPDTATLAIRQNTASGIGAAGDVRLPEKLRRGWLPEQWQKQFWTKKISAFVLTQLNSAE